MRKADYIEFTRKVYLAFAVISFVLWQFLVFRYLSNSGTLREVYYLYVSLSVSIVFFVFYWFRVNPLYLFGLIFAYSGSFLILFNSWKTIPSFGLFTLFAVFAVLGYMHERVEDAETLKDLEKSKIPQKKKKTQKAKKKKAAPDVKQDSGIDISGLIAEGYIFNIRSLLYTFAVAVVIAAVPFIIYHFLKNTDTIFQWYFPIRSAPGTGYGGLISVAFNDHKDIIYSVLFAGLIIGVLKAVFAEKIKKEWLMLLILFVVTFAAKLVIVKLSFSDLHTLSLKVETQSYYFWANKIEGFRKFMSDYVIQFQRLSDSAHVKGHPPLCLLFHWWLCKMISCVPQVAGYFISFITALTVIPVYYIVKAVAKNKQAAFLGAIFYAVSPNSTVLSAVAMDAFVVLFFASSFALYIYGEKNRSLLTLFAGGFMLGVASYFSFGIWHLMLPIALSGVLMEFDKERKIDLKPFIKIAMRFLVFLAGTLVLHLLFILVTKGSFSYIDSFKMAQSQSMPIMFARPYELWVWANVFHWSQYAGAALVALFIMRYVSALRGKIKIDWYSIIALCAIITQFLTCIGRAEAHRMWMFLIVFMIPVSVIALLRKVNDEVKPGFTMSYVFTLLIFLSSVLLEIFIVDIN